MDYYPGDDFVDIVGVDGFNWGSSFFWGEGEINKPHRVNSFGTGATNQATWIADAVAQAKARGISGLIYFSYPGQGGTDFTLIAEG